MTGGDLHGLLGQIEGMVEAFSGALRELEEQKVTGRDATGGVAATVSGSGRLLSVDIAGRAMRDLDHVALSGAVREAIEAARVAMAEGVDAAVQAMGGGGSPTGDPLEAFFDAALRETDHG
ncbi:YbaB/EbfC family nucleoid-associated protein [Nonomuraea sp. NPDC050536]|uniref:YbaB/EbfC family nucleoid-associated protein n=1 Tax=Nonomuraea sp. NPDC050536 TaxID=3364366 RepID=UPI0037C95119